MTKDIQDLMGMLIICLGTSIVCATLLILWYRITDRAWPDRDTIFGLAKISFGIGALGMAMFLFFKFA
jgi:hypothetical protein